MMRAATYARSTVWWGREVCPPGPLRVIEMRSEAPVMPPSLIPDSRPARGAGSTWKAMSDRSFEWTPSSRKAVAPPGIHSSAGWKMNRAAPGRSPSRLQRQRRCLRRSRYGRRGRTHGPRSEPERRIRPSFSSAIGSASRSARKPTVGSPSPTSAMRPTPSSRIWGSIPAASRAAATTLVVRRSTQPTSGLRWMSRRSATDVGAISWRGAPDAPIDHSWSRVRADIAHGV